MTAPKLSPSAVETHLRCAQQDLIFRVEGHIAPPEVGLRRGVNTHKVILEDGIRPLTQGKAPPGDPELVEIYLDTLRTDEELLSARDLDEYGGFTALYDAEAVMFPKLLQAAKPWREGLQPWAVEVALPKNANVLGLPVTGRVDLIEYATGVQSDRVVTDLKRRGPKARPFKPEDVASSIQLITYASALDLPSAGFAGLHEGKKPYMAPVRAEITTESIERVAAQIDAVYRAREHGIFPPVNRLGPTGWVCSARYCGAWSADAVDAITGVKIACPHGQRSQASASLAGNEETE